MSKFKVGDSVRLINPKGWGGKRKGSIYKIAEVGKAAYDLDDGTVVEFMYESDWESSDKAPGFQREHKYRVKPEPDHTAEIAEIERKMRELSWCQNNLATSQKELADRLDKLK